MLCFGCCVLGIFYYTAFEFSRKNTSYHLPTHISAYSSLKVEGLSSRLGTAKCVKVALASPITSNEMEICTHGVPKRQFYLWNHWNQYINAWNILFQHKVLRNRIGSESTDKEDFRERKAKTNSQETCCLSACFTSLLMYLLVTLWLI